MNEKRKKFLWGVTNIGGQVESACKTSDWYAWACRDQVPRIGQANDYLHGYKTDHDLAQELDCSAFRLNIEWARIEPRKGEFNEDAIARYREILSDLKGRNITTVVGLWHYTLPQWFARKYGMHHATAPEFFEKYAHVVLKELGDLIDVVVILNEPIVYLGLGYIRAQRPPFYRDPYKAWHVLRNLVRIQKNAYTLWKEKYPGTLIGSAQLCNDYQGRTTIEKIAVSVSRYFRYEYFLSRTKNYQDFVGVNYYVSSNVKFNLKESGSTFGFRSTNDWHDPDVWKSFPEGFYHALVCVYARYKQPIIVLENGKPSVGGAKDCDRQEFLTQSVYYMKKAMSDGVDVCGYFHHSLTDCYEWDSGYDFKFGLVEVDRDTLKRTKRGSFETYKQIIMKNTQ